jgi:hypothetical protein
MTRQIPDRLIYEEIEYIILSANGRGLSAPQDFGMSPLTMHTACLRGYQVEYTYADRTLYLTEMTLRTADGSFATIGGIEPSVSDGGVGTYADLRVEVPFTGGLLIARRIKKMKRGDLTPMDFEVVKEVAFDKGQIVSAMDHSAGLAAISEPAEEGWPFSRKYDLRYYQTTIGKATGS